MLNSNVHLNNAIRCMRFAGDDTRENRNNQHTV